MIGYHVTTPRKVQRYTDTGCILPPVRFWPNEYTARRWAKRTGRSVVLQIEVDISHPLPDHKPARWSPDLVRSWVDLNATEPKEAHHD